MRMWLAERADIPMIGPLLEREWVVYLATYGALMLDLLVVPLLVWRPSRIAAFVVAVTFHALNWQLFSIGVFPLFMIAGRCYSCHLTGWVQSHAGHAANLIGRSRPVTTLSLSQVPSMESHCDPHSV